MNLIELDTWVLGSLSNFMCFGSSVDINTILSQACLLRAVQRTLGREASVEVQR